MPKQDLFGVGTLPRKMDLMNAQEYLDHYRAAYALHNETYPNDFRVLPPAYSDSAWAANGNPDTKWQDLINNTQAFKQNHYLSISGGSRSSTFMFSANYIAEDGVLITTNRDQFNVRLNSTHSIGKRIRIGENFAFTVANGRNAGDRWIDAAIASPIMPVFNPAAEKGYQGPVPAITGANDRTNPLAELELPENTYTDNNAFGNVYFELDLLEGLTFRTVFGVTYFDGRSENWVPKYELEQRSNPTASLALGDNLSQGWQFDKILRYDKTFGDHTIGALAGHSAEKRFFQQITASTRDFRWENLRTIAGGNPEFTSSSQNEATRTGDAYFGRISYDYAGKYLFTGSVRRDGSSRFGRNFRYGVFPSFSAGWKVNGDFFKNTPWMDVLKLRFGYGQTGNLPGRDFLYDTFISSFPEHVYTLGVDDRVVFGAAPFYNFGSPNLKWESAIMTNFGFDFIGLNNKLELYVEYFIKNQNDLIT
ncbi:MAG: TonB-dependent receptor, partial [Bacteroidota bacterium]